MTDEKDTKNGSAELLSDMLIKSSDSDLGGDAGLIVEPHEAPSDSFAVELEKSLSETEAEARRQINEDEAQSQSWLKARAVVEGFRPVPWFIWRLTNSVFGRGGETKPIPEGMVLGLRRLLFAAASEPLFSDAGKVNNLRQALKVLSPDVIAAVSVIHSICRRLANCQFERIWRPILDDAVLRAQLGYFVGERNHAFGGGRGMLAGFAGRCGLAIAIATGDLDQARRALELLATGAPIAKVGMSIYGCDPLQVSAMALSASGCGRDAAFGTVSYAVAKEAAPAENTEQFCWLSAFTIVELVRIGKDRDIDMSYWQALAYNIGQDRAELIEVSRTLVRRGHQLQWIL